jgi:hypothetical protein
VPIDKTLTVSHLLNEAVRHAASLGVLYAPDRSVLRVGGRDGAILHGPDLIIDVLGSAVNNEFWLGELPDSAFLALVSVAESNIGQMLTCAVPAAWDIFSQVTREHRPKQLQQIQHQQHHQQLQYKHSNRRHLHQKSKQGAYSLDYRQARRRPPAPPLGAYRLEICPGEYDRRGTP